MADWLDTTLGSSKTQAGSNQSSGGGGGDWLSTTLGSGGGQSAYRPNQLVSDIKPVSSPNQPIVSQPNQVSKVTNQIQGLNFKNLGKSLIAGSKLVPGQIQQASGVIASSVLSSVKTIDTFFNKKSFQTATSFLPGTGNAVNLYSATSRVVKDIPGVSNRLSQAGQAVEQFGATQREQGFQSVQRESIKYLAEKEPSEGLQRIFEMVAFNLPQMAATTGLSIATAVITKNPATASAVMLTSGYGLGASETYNQAREFGLSDAQALPLAQVGGTVIGALEYIPFNELLTKSPVANTIKKSLFKNVVSGIVDVGKQGTFEAITENLQEVVGNAIARTYDENRKLFDAQQISDTTWVSFITGGLADVTLGTAVSVMGTGTSDQQVAKETEKRITQAFATDESKRTAEQQMIVEAVSTQQWTADEAMSVVTENNLGKSEEGKVIVKTAMEAKQTGQEIRVSPADDGSSLKVELVPLGSKIELGKTTTDQEQVIPRSKPTSEVTTQLDEAIENYVKDEGVYKSPDGKPQETPALMELSALASQPEVIKFTQEQVKNIPTNEDGTITLFRGGRETDASIADNTNRLVSASYNRSSAENFTRTGKDLMEFKVKPEDVKVFIGGNEAEVLIPGNKVTKQEQVETDQEDINSAELDQVLGQADQEALSNQDFQSIVDEINKHDSADSFIKTFEDRTNKIEFGDDTPDSSRGITKEDIELKRSFMILVQKQEYQDIYENGGNDTDALRKMFEQYRGESKKSTTQEKTKKPKTKTPEQLNQELRDIYKNADQQAIEDAYTDLWRQLEFAQAGQRFFNDEGNFSAPSTFPDWVPEELRSRKLFDIVMEQVSDLENLTLPPNKNTRQQELFEQFLAEIDDAVGTDSSQIIQQIKESYDKEKATPASKPKTKTDRGTTRSKKPAGEQEIDKKIADYIEKRKTVKFREENTELSESFTSKQKTEILFRREKTPTQAGFIDIRGEKLSSDNQDDNLIKLASLLKDFRNPDREVFHLVYMKGDEIVGHKIISSNEHDIVIISPKEVIFNIEERMNRLGADSVYTVHNHPSGNTEPSRDDLNFAFEIENRLNKPGNRVNAGNIILDHDNISVFGSVGLDTVNLKVDLGISYASSEGRLQSPLDFRELVDRFYQPTQGKVGVFVLGARFNPLAIKEINSDNPNLSFAIKQVVREKSGSIAMLAMTEKDAMKLREKGKIEAMDIMYQKENGEMESMREQYGSDDFSQTAGRMQKGDKPIPKRKPIETTDKQEEKFRVKDDVKQFTGKTITDAQETEIINLNKKIFGDDNVKITLQIMANRQALGSSREGMITIVDGQANPKDTFYHEAVHKFIDVFTTRDEQTALFKAGIDKYGTTDLNLVEENIAEDFINYAKSREGLTGSIRKIIDQILTRIKKYLGNVDQIESLYQEILSPAKKKTQKVAKPTPTPASQPKTADIPHKEGFSRFQERLEQQLLDSNGNRYNWDDTKQTYDKISLKEDARKAATLLEKNPEKAMRIAKGFEQPGEKDARLFDIYNAVALKAFDEGNVELGTQMINKTSLTATRYGQEIATLRGNFNDNSPQNFIKQVIDARLERLGKTRLSEVEKLIGKKKSAKTKAMAQVDLEVEKLKKRVRREMKLKQDKIKIAQDIIDSLKCT